jgi:hypothetical protein
VPDNLFEAAAHEPEEEVVFKTKKPKNRNLRKVPQDRDINE